MRVLDGNAGHRPGNLEAPIPIGDLMDAPPELTEKQRATWRLAITHSPPGLLKHLDRSVFQSWVIAVDMLEQIRGKIADFGVVIKGPKGSAIVNPLLREQSRYANLVRQLAAEMGFSPTARQRVKVDKPVQTAGNPFGDLKSLDD